jgi:hypothetical protein
MSPMSRKPKQVTGPTVFLDIDGVLIVPELHVMDRWMLPSFRAVNWAFLPSAVTQLRRILAGIPEARLVISSTWRMGHRGGGRDIVEQLFQKNDALDLLARFHGPTAAWCTPLEPSDHGLRVWEIRGWLRHHEPTAFCALDDDPEIGLLREGVPIDPEQGLTEADADRAIALLRLAPGGSDGRNSRA